MTRNQAAYEDYINMTQRQLEGKRSRSPSVSNNGELRAFKCRVDTTSELQSSRNLTPQERKRRSLNLSFSASPLSPPLLSAEEPISPYSESLSHLQHQHLSSNHHQRHRSVEFGGLSTPPPANTKRASLNNNRRSGFIGLDSLSSWSSPSSSETSFTSNVSDARSNRWSQHSTNSINRLSMLSHTSEQDKVLQERLQQLARSENAKLIDSVISLDIPPSPEFDSEMNQQNEQITTPQHETSIKRISEQDIYVMPSDELEKLTLRRESSTSHSEALTPNSKATNKEVNSSIAKNIYKYNAKANDNDDESNEKASPGPARPGDIHGTVLSWKMAGDIVRTSAQSAASPKEFADLAKFIWTMFSRPENFNQISVSSTKDVLPPADVILNLKDQLPGTQEALKRSAHLLKSLAYSGFAFSVVFVQMLLIVIMVLAYVVGDVLVSPVLLVQKLTGKNQKPMSVKAMAKKQAKRSSRIRKRK